MAVSGPITPTDATLEQERWRSQVLEGRFASLRTQATALLAVIAVILESGWSGRRSR